MYLVCLFNHVCLFTVEVNGALVVRHHSVSSSVGICQEVWQFVESNIDLADWRGVVNTRQRSSEAVWNINTGLHQPEQHH